MNTRLPIAVAIAAALLSPVAAPRAATPTLPQVEVTSSKLPTEVDRSSDTVTVIDAAMLRNYGAHDLRSALAQVAGVEAAPGGDGGPAASVPALWGLKEFDAFLLLVDGVPWGGAFVPALASIDLAGVERIEVLKGGAPVSYGATAFVGVIHVIHYAAGQGPAVVSAAYGSHGSARASASLSLAPVGDLQQSVLLSGERNQWNQDRSGFDRAHALYRLATPLAGGDFGVDVDLSILRQDPSSPTPREGPALTSQFGPDSNQNPSDARLDENRWTVSARYAHETSLGPWNSTLSYAHSSNDITRGFLREGFSDGSSINADGYRQDRDIDDLYLDSHLATTLGPHSTLLWGVDWLHGDGEQHSRNFEYAVRLDGRNAPSAASRPVDEQTRTRARRNFAGAYVELDHALSDAWRVHAGLRANLTRERRNTSASDGAGALLESGRDSRNDDRLTGALGSSYRLWENAGDQVTLYANYKDTFKPAVVDFGPEAEADILEAEEATSGELGLRGKQFDGRLDWDAAAFYMDFSNLVVAQPVDGRPGLVNAGRQYFKGIEVEASYALAADLSMQGSWAWHSARFGDYVRLFGDSLRQLRGNAQEMTPDHLASLGLAWAPAQGFGAHLAANYVGDRWLNARNTAPAHSYATIDAGLDYRFGAWDLRLDGYDLNDRRDPVAESELGDAQYYRLPGRSAWLSLSYDIGG